MYIVQALDVKTYDHYRHGSIDVLAICINKKTFSNLHVLANNTLIF